MCTINRKRTVLCKARSDLAERNEKESFLDTKFRFFAETFLSRNIRKDYEEIILCFTYLFCKFCSNIYFSLVQFYYLEENKKR